MKPKPSPAIDPPDLFQSNTNSINSLQHPLLQLAEEFNWNAFERQPHSPYCAHTAAPGINARLMVALHSLKDQQDLSAGGAS